MIILLVPPTNLQYPFVYQNFISLVNMSLESFMALSAAHLSVLTPEILLKISAFITYIPQFKNNIILVQATDWPLDIAPLYLPQSIALLLSNLCEASEEAIEMLWTFTKQIIWEYSGRASVQRSGLVWFFSLKIGNWQPQPVWTGLDWFGPVFQRNSQKQQFLWLITYKTDGFWMQIFGIMSYNVWTVQNMIK